MNARNEAFRLQFLETDLPAAATYAAFDERDRPIGREIVEDAADPVVAGPGAGGVVVFIFVWNCVGQQVQSESRLVVYAGELREGEDGLGEATAVGGERLFVLEDLVLVVVQFVFRVEIEALGVPDVESGALSAEDV